MLFNSFEFMLFLPIVFLLYWFVFKPRRLQNLFLVIASYIFYGWWDWRFLFLIALTSACSFASGLLLEHYEGKRKAQQIVSASNIVLNLLILGVFKYYNFFVESLESLFISLFNYHLDWVTINVILPVGISFYTFQALSYTIDVYQKKLPATHDIVEFFAYISFFPQLVAGPIERATNLLPQFQKDRQFDYAKAIDGFRQMLWGFFKKIVIADNCASVVNGYWDSYQDLPGLTLFLMGVMFTFQIYCDFSGYSDIAIGTAKLFGIKLMRNFNVPYFSRNMAEFWRRWHISLTTWFRDYVYIPMGGSQVSKAKVVRNVFVIFLLSGFWHGSNWTFIAWGAYHAVLFLPLILLGKNRTFTDNVAEGRKLPKLKEAGQMLLTFILATLGWILFRAESIGQAWTYVCGIFNKSLFTTPWINSPTYMLPMPLILIILIVLEWNGRHKDCPIKLEKAKKPWQWVLYVLLVIMIFTFGKPAETFIYFQF